MNILQVEASQVVDKKELMKGSSSKDGSRGDGFGAFFAKESEQNSSTKSDNHNGKNWTPDKDTAITDVNDNKNEVIKADNNQSAIVDADDKHEQPNAVGQSETVTAEKESSIKNDSAQKLSDHDEQQLAQMLDVNEEEKNQLDGIDTIDASANIKPSITLVTGQEQSSVSNKSGKTPEQLLAFLNDVSSVSTVHKTSAEHKVTTEAANETTAKSYINNTLSEHVQKENVKKSNASSAHSDSLIDSKFNNQLSDKEIEPSKDNVASGAVKVIKDGNHLLGEQDKNKETASVTGFKDPVKGDLNSLVSNEHTTDNNKTVEGSISGKKQSSDGNNNQLLSGQSKVSPDKVPEDKKADKSEFDSIKSAKYKELINQESVENAEHRKTKDISPESNSIASKLITELSGNKSDSSTDKNKELIIKDGKNIAKSIGTAAEAYSQQSLDQNSNHVANDNVAKNIASANVIAGQNHAKDVIGKSEVKLETAALKNDSNSEASLSNNEQQGSEQNPSEKHSSQNHFNAKSEIEKTESSQGNKNAENNKVKDVNNILGQTTSIQAAQESATVSQAITDKITLENITPSQSKPAVNLSNETIAINKKDFSEKIKEKVMVMVNQKIRQVDIRLDPPELGSMQVRLNLQNEQAAVNFIVQNQQAKEAVDENMSKLKEMLSDSGVDVGDASVEQHDKNSDDNASADERFAGSQGNNEQMEENIENNGAQLYKASSTGVDYFV